MYICILHVSILIHVNTYMQMYKLMYDSSLLGFLMCNRENFEREVFSWSNFPMLFLMVQSAETVTLEQVGFRSFSLIHSLKP